VEYDVMTSGGHTRAVAAYLLASFRIDVVLAICGARADSVPRDNPFEQSIDTLEDFEPER